MSIEFSPIEIFKEVRHFFLEKTYRQEYLAKICDVFLGEDWAPNDNKYLLDMKWVLDMDNIWVKAGYCMLSSPHPSRVHQRSKIINTLKQQVNELQTVDAQVALEVLMQVEPDGITHVLSSTLKKDERFFSEKKQFVDLVSRVGEPVSRQILRDAIICILQKRSKHIDADDLEDTDYIELAEVLGKLGDIRLGQMRTIHSDDRKIPFFQIAQYPITNVEFQACVNDRQVAMPLHWKGEFPIYLSNHPVTNISYDDAVAYCKWLSGKQHRN